MPLVENPRLHGAAAASADAAVLPRLPSVPGFEAAARYVAAGESFQVGGDFYDVFDAGPGGWVAVIGDVCGKGPGAAAVTALALDALHAAAWGQSSPAAALLALNDRMLNESSVTRHCTAVYARLRRSGDSVSITSASGGHPLPMIVRAGGLVEQLGQCGTLLGAIEEVELTESRAQLGAGDALVLYTDGVTDAHAPARILSEPDLCAVLAPCAGASAEALAAAVERAALAGGSERPRDDIAILVLKRV